MHNGGAANPYIHVYVLSATMAVEEDENQLCKKIVDQAASLYV